MSRRALAAAAALVVVAAIGWNGFQAWRQGYQVEGDTAIIALRTFDVFTSNPPLLGNPTTAGTQQAQDAYHPGPLEFYALAIPLRLWAPEPVGLLVGVALVNMAAVALLVGFAHRRRGPPAAIGAALFAAVLLYGLGSEIPHDAYNPHIGLLPLALLVVLVWSIADGDRPAIPAAVAAGSFIAQSHGYQALTVAGLGALAIVGLVIERDGRPLRRWLLGSGLLALVLWLPPIIDQVRHRPGNLRLLWDQARAPGNPPEGIRFALDRLAEATTPPFRWLGRQPDFLELHRHVSGARIGLALTVVVVLALAGVMAVRRGQRTTALLVATAVGALVVSTAVASRLPQGVASASPYNHRHWWITGIFAWFAGTWCAIDLLKDRVPAGLLRRLPAAGVAAVVGVAVVTSSQVRLGEDRDSFSFRALDALIPPVADAVRGKGPVVVAGRGGQAFFSIEPGIVSALVQRGIDARVQSFEAKIFQPFRVGGAEIATWVDIVSGDGSAPVPPGCSFVARYDARPDYEAGFRNTGIAGRAEVIQVQLCPPPVGGG